MVVELMGASKRTRGNTHTCTKSQSNRHYNTKYNCFVTHSIL